MMIKVSGVCWCVCPCEQLWLEAFLGWTWACEGWWRGQSSAQYWGKFGLCSHKCLLTSVPHPDSPTHQLFTPTNMNLISHIHIRCCFFPLFLNMHIRLCVCVCLCLCAWEQRALWQPAALLPATLCRPAEPPSTPTPTSVDGARGTHVHCRGPCFGY